MSCSLPGYLACLDEHVRALDTLRQTDVSAITEIEIANRRAKMIAQQDKF